MNLTSLGDLTLRSIDLRNRHNRTFQQSIIHPKTRSPQTLYTENSPTLIDLQSISNTHGSLTSPWDSQHSHKGIKAVSGLIL